MIPNRVEKASLPHSSAAPALRGCWSCPGLPTRKPCALWSRISWTTPCFHKQLLWQVVSYSSSGLDNFNVPVFECYVNTGYFRKYVFLKTGSKIFSLLRCLLRISTCFSHLQTASQYGRGRQGLVLQNRNEKPGQCIRVTPRVGDKGNTPTENPSKAQPPFCAARRLLCPTEASVMILAAWFEPSPWAATVTTRPRWTRLRELPVQEVVANAKILGGLTKMITQACVSSAQLLLCILQRHLDSQLRD